MTDVEAVTLLDETEIKWWQGGPFGLGAFTGSTLLLTFAFLTLLPGAVLSQARVIRPAPSRLFALGAGASVAAQDTLPKVGDHRVTGAVIGALAGGVLGYVIAANAFGGGTCTTDVPEVCSSDQTLEKALVTLGGATVGAGLGYLMGKSTPKAGPERKPPPLAPIVDTGISPSTGAGLGALIGAAAFTYLGSTSDSGDGEPWVIDTGFGALVGAFLGYGMARE